MHINISIIIHYLLNVFRFQWGNDGVLQTIIPQKYVRCIAMCVHVQSVTK